MSRIRPQVMAAILGLMLIALVITFVAPDHIVEIVGSAITGIGMLAMKVIEDKE